MNEEEKKTIESLKKFKSIKVLYGNTFTMFTEQLDELQKSIETILNLIDKTTKECKFIQCEDDMDNNYICTGCGEVWCFEEYTPVEVDCNYCSKCGTKITEVIE